MAVKLDLRRLFDSVDHAILDVLLRRKLKLPLPREAWHHSMGGAVAMGMGFVKKA